MMTIIGFSALLICLLALVVYSLYWTVKLAKEIPHVDQHSDPQDYIDHISLFPWTKS